MKWWRTDAGRKAYAILDWVNADVSRAPEGMAKIVKLAEATADPAASNEIADVSLIISRLLPTG